MNFTSQQISLSVAFLRGGFHKINAFYPVFCIYRTDILVERPPNNLFT